MKVLPKDLEDIIFSYKRDLDFGECLEEINNIYYHMYISQVEQSSWRTEKNSETIMYDFDTWNDCDLAIYRKNYYIEFYSELRQCENKNDGYYVCERNTIKEVEERAQRLWEQEKNKEYEEILENQKIERETDAIEKESIKYHRYETIKSEKRSNIMNKQKFKKRKEKLKNIKKKKKKKKNKGKKYGTPRLCSYKEGR